MALQQVYWNQRQVAVSWTGSFIHATVSPPPRKSTVAYSRLFINHSRTPGVVLWSYHANIARGSTSHSVRDVELDRDVEKDTEGGEKHKVQLDGLTDRVIV